jgi:FlaA1/EpsC-like NDP-sugar epimerase
MGRGSEVFVLDMGEPVRISDLARDLIRLSGLEPERDIEIKYTGLRPGEKLFEELFNTGEDYGRTEHEKIFRYRNGRIGDSEGSLNARLDALFEAARCQDEDAMFAGLRELVPEYAGDEKVAT